MGESRQPDAEHGGGPGPGKRRQPLTQRTYHTVIDRQIAAGEAEGAFDNLPGSGRPLKFEDDSMVPDEVRVGYRMLKSAGFAPPWVELRKEIREEQAKLEAWLTRANGRWLHANAGEQTRLRDEYRAKIAELNRLILTYNLSVPQAVGQMPALRPEDELARLGT